MELLLVRHDTETGGARQQRLQGSVFQVGRGSQCEIHLPDSRVALVHARITLDEAGAALEAVEQRIVHNDRELAGAQLAPGDHIEVGPYLLTVEPAPAGAALALSVRLSQRVATKGRTSLSRALLRAPRLSKRRLSYAAFIGMLVVGLVAPIASDLVDSRRVPLAEPLAAGFAQAWNPGELVRAHLPIAQDCRACHKVAFQRVPDTACGACHGAVREHVASTKLAGPSAFMLAETRCAQCHRDHKGRAMSTHSDQLCAQCHARMEQAAVQAGLQKVSDFARDHPQFRVSILDPGPGAPVRRVRQRDPEAKVVERSNLKFNHTLHLDPAGVRDPRKKPTVLACADCHEAEGGARIAPVSMERHCSGCHELTFDPQVTRRAVRHAPLEEVERGLREFYARLAIGDVPPDVTPPRDLPRLRPGAAATAEERREVLRIADERANRAMRELVQTRAVCSTCHYVRRETHAGRTTWTLAPVALTSSWMPGANFRHDKHTAQPCITCHDVRSSRRAEDVAMPDIARCRECHAGAQGGMGKVASECATCHVFHGGKNAWH